MRCWAVRVHSGFRSTINEKARSEALLILAAHLFERLEWTNWTRYQSGMLRCWPKPWFIFAIFVARRFVAAFVPTYFRRLDSWSPDISSRNFSLPRHFLVAPLLLGLDTISGDKQSRDRKQASSWRSMEQIPWRGSSGRLSGGPEGCSTLACGAIGTLSNSFLAHS